jgi:GNAT superfamily N-acetyltransferase
MESTNGTPVALRDATPQDRAFIDGLSPRLAGVPHPPWHDDRAMEGFQDRYMATTFGDMEEGARTVLACAPDGRRLGYVHMRPGTDGVTNEPCGYVSLLALISEAEGQGIAHRLMQETEAWARGRGYRLLSLDVFAHNRHAVEFYHRRGFVTESLRLVKPL